VEVFIVLPTYNEADNLLALAAEVLGLPANVRLLVVDDASPDGTGRLADRLAHDHPGRVHVLHRERKLGLGTAYRAGFRYALARDAEAVLTMDADFSHHPRHIPEMIRRLEACDLVIGSRYVAGGGTKGCPWYRRLLSGGANGVARALLGLHARDATAGFRLYRRSVLESIPLEQIFSSGYSFLVEMLYLVEECGWAVAEVPILFEDRRAGQTKISQAEILRAAHTVFRLAGRRARRGWRSARTRLAGTASRVP
jgi:dolichol-phosphate mannosyltransferase